MNIRSSLLASFSVIIVILVLVGALLMVLQNSIEQEYEMIATDTMSEYQLGEGASQLISTYTSLLQNINDPSLSAQYQNNLDAINVAASNLDGTTLSSASATIYQRLRSEIALLEGYIAHGVANAKQGDFSQSANIFEQVDNANNSIQQDTASLIVSDVGGMEETQGSVNTTEALERTIGIMMIIIVIGGIILLAFLLSNRLSRPIIRLAGIAETISEGGSLAARVDEKLMHMKNEVGSLARSFNHMVLDVEKRVDDRTRELQQERARLLASINSLPLGFLLLDTAGVVLIANSVAKENFTGQDLTLASIGNLFVPAMDATAFNDLMAKKQSYELQEAQLGEKSFRIMATPVLLSGSDEKDSLIGSVMLMEDITQEKMLERSKNTFLAIAAHEMRTPLTVIRGEAELMFDEPSVGLDTGLKAQIGSILNSAVRLLSIVNDFLDVQNLEGGRVSLNIEPVDAAGLMKDVIRDLSVLAEKKGLTITLDTSHDPEGFILNVDKGRLQQIYVNLISNAIHYTEHGGVAVFLKKESKVIKITFEDTGIGIDAEEQQRLFRKFETGRAFIQSREYGSGLGLYISRFLAHLMGGDIVLERSEPGKGSVFCLTLPLTGLPRGLGLKKP